MNTELRKLAKNDFEKDLFKMINNSVFGKTMENIRKDRVIKLLTTDKKRYKLVSEPNYHTINLISEDLSIIEMTKTKVKMNKPIYLGLSILEISKILMYEFWYDYMKPKYNDNVKLCYSDTDSFIINIKTNDLSIIEMKKTKVKMNKPIYLGLSILEISKTLMYEFWYDYMKPKCNDNVKLCYSDTDSFIINIKTNDFYEDIATDVENRFDTSNYEVKRPLPMGKNKKVIGLMKDELGGKIITEFVT